jgi:hypothetical protein
MVYMFEGAASATRSKSACCGFGNEEWISSLRPLMATPSHECGVIEARPSSATYISPLDVPIFYSF